MHNVYSSVQKCHCCSLFSSPYSISIALCFIILNDSEWHAAPEIIARTSALWLESVHKGTRSSASTNVFYFILQTYRYIVRGIWQLAYEILYIKVVLNPSSKPNAVKPAMLCSLGAAHHDDLRSEGDRFVFASRQLGAQKGRSKRNFSSLAKQNSMTSIGDLIYFILLAGKGDYLQIIG